jgi:general secretion pathway protein H
VNPVARKGRGRFTPHPIRGFTLIEMLVVLIIISIALAVTPSLLDTLPGARLHAAADALAGTLRRLRNDALVTGQGTALVIDPGSRSYVILPGGRRQTLPDTIGAIDVATNARLQSGGAAEFRFFADGTATGGTITLREGNRAAGVAVDWLTGRVHLRD